MVRGNNRWKESVAGLGGLALVDILPFNFCCSVPFWNARRVSNFVKSGRAEGGLPLSAGIEAENSQCIDWFLAFMLKVR